MQSFPRLFKADKESKIAEYLGTEKSVQRVPGGDDTRRTREVERC